MSADLPSKHVVIGLPSYDGTRYNGMALARLLKNPPPDLLINLIELRTSALAFGFNILWANVLNFRQHPTHPPTHYLLWHADVVPQTENWLGIMLSEMERVGADVLSAVIPIKNELGMTSTAREADPPNRWRPLRYTLTEVSVMADPTWTAPGLLVNTGLMLVDLRKDWVERVHFTLNDRIYRGSDGKWRASMEPEDWNFSRQCHALGVSLYATKAIVVDHVGTTNYRSSNVWGYPTDIEYMKAIGEDATSA